MRRVQSPTAADLAGRDAHRRPSIGDESNAEREHEAKERTTKSRQRCRDAGNEGKRATAAATPRPAEGPKARPFAHGVHTGSVEGHRRRHRPAASRPASPSATRGTPAASRRLRLRTARSRPLCSLKFAHVDPEDAGGERPPRAPRARPRPIARSAWPPSFAGRGERAARRLRVARTHLQTSERSSVATARGTRACGRPVHFA